MTVTARHTRPDEGVRLEMPDGGHIVKASAEETGGAFEVFEVEAGTTRLGSSRISQSIAGPGSSSGARAKPTSSTV